MVGICQGETEIPLLRKWKPENRNEGYSRGQVMKSISGQPRQVGDQTSICWIASNGGASQKIELGFAPAGLETVRAAQRRTVCRIGAQRGPAGTCHNSSTVVNRVFTRMSLAGYSLTGWSPPEPVSASPAEKNFTWIDLHASKKRTPQAGADWAEKARSAASRYATSLRATSSVARLA